MRLAFRFTEDVHFTADAGGQRHNVRFAQRIDRRVSDLRELLAEVIVNDTRLAGEHGKWGIIAHRADRFLAIFTQYAQDGIQLFGTVVELFLIAGEGIIVQLAATDLFVRQFFERHQTTDVFRHPLFIRVTAFQIVVGFRGVQNTPLAGIDNHQFAWTDAAFFNDFIRLIIPDTHLGCAGDELIFGDHIACRTQAITVEVTGGEATIGHHDARRAVPRFHMHGVKVKERAQLGIHIRVILPGWRNQQAHCANDVHPARQQQLQHVIHRAGVRAGFVNERRGVVEVRD